jgi:hypothetical protein
VTPDDERRALAAKAAADAPAAGTDTTTQES